VNVEQNQSQTSEESLKKEDVTNEESKSESKNPESIRQVIKIGDQDTKADSNKDDQTSTQEKNEKKEISNKKESSQEPLKKQIEEKKEYLKQIKEFDFRISENKKQINEFEKSLNNVNANLDDLVSLYEIVSEQMNPFVGLSNVTKKRIEALETYSKDIEVLKSRMMEIESDLDQSKNETSAVKNQKSKKIETTNKKNINDTNDSIYTNETPAVKNHKPIKIEPTNKKDTNDTKNNIETIEIPDSVSSWENDLSDDDLEKIIEKSLQDINMDKEIDQKIMMLLGE
jgi:flagellar protein FlaC